jgi:hypothetical protein
MRIAIISDIHDCLPKLDLALPAVADCDELICCGDLCSPFIVDELANGFSRPVHIVFGNNDADLYRITSKTRQFPNINLYGELCTLERDGRRIAVQHFDYIARPLAKSGQFDVVCFGHNHEFEITRYGSTLALNPGSILGARFSSGRREDVASTFLVLDAASMAATGYEFTLDAGAMRKISQAVS